MYSMVEIDVYVHHRGYFARPPNGPVQYVGGVVDNLVENTDTFCFADLEHYSDAFDYYDQNSLVYCQCDGHTFDNDVMVLYDDDSIKKMVEICKPFGSIHLFVDHFDLEDLEDKAADEEDKMNNVSEFSEGSDNNDPDFEANDESDPELKSDESDPELIENVRNMKIRKAAEANKKNGELRIKYLKFRDEESEGSEYLSDELRSLPSSSEDETCKKGYIGPAPSNKRKKKEKCIL